MEHPSLPTGTIPLPAELPAIPHGTTNEKLIVGKLVTDLLAAGFWISVFDGEETTVRRSKDPAAIFPALASTDADHLNVGRDGADRLGWIYLVWGNDHEIISDYTTNLEPYLSGANSLAEQLDGRGR